MQPLGAWDLLADKCLRQSCYLHLHPYQDRSIGWSNVYASSSTANKSTAETASSKRQITGKKPGETADHSKFEILQQDFKSGPEVTKACLSCHTEAATQVHDSIHWKWEYDNEKTGQKAGQTLCH